MKRFVCQITSFCRKSKILQSRLLLISLFFFSIVQNFQFEINFHELITMNDYSKEYSEPTPKLISLDSQFEKFVN